MEGITNQVSAQTECRLSSGRGPFFLLFSQCLWRYPRHNKHFSSISRINWTKERSARGRSRSSILKNLRDYMKAIKNENSGNFFQSQYSFSLGALSWHIFFLSLLLFCSPFGQDLWTSITSTRYNSSPKLPSMISFPFQAIFVRRSQCDRQC